MEDLLQEDIYPTLELLRNAGLQIWMLTGDKVETATCIAISAGLKSKQQDLYTIRETEDNMELLNCLTEFGNKTDCILIIDGISLNAMLKNQFNLFMQVATSAPAVVCCRVSPTQKAEITEYVKSFTGKIVLGIGRFAVLMAGDGGNDVGMILSANVGVGIAGKEGKQAALASDFSITKFKHLANLLLWHGRLSYKRCSLMS